MLGRAKRIAGQAAKALANPLVVAMLPHDVRAVLVDAGAELVQLNQRVDRIELALGLPALPLEANEKGDPDGRDSRQG